MMKFFLWADGRRAWHDVDSHQTQIKMLRRNHPLLRLDEPFELKATYDTFHRRTIKLGSTVWTEFHQDSCDCGICTKQDEWLPPELKEFCCRIGVIDVDEMPSDELKHMNDACNRLGVLPLGAVGQ